MCNWIFAQTKRRRFCIEIALINFKVHIERFLKLFDCFLHFAFAGQMDKKLEQLQNIFFFYL